MVNWLRLCSNCICRVFNCIHNSSQLKHFNLHLEIFTQMPSKFTRYHKNFFRLSSGPSSAKPSSTDLPLDSLNCRPVRPKAPWNWCPGGDFSMALPPQKPSQLPRVETNPRQGDKPTSLCMFHYIHMWGFMRSSFKKVHCFEFLAGASSADWSWIKGATCPNQIFRKYHDFWHNILSTSGLNYSPGEDLEHLEHQVRLRRANMWSHKDAWCMHKNQRHLPISWHPSHIQKGHGSEHGETCLEVLEVWQEWLHSRDFQSRIDAMKNSTFLRWRRGESRRKFANRTAGFVDA